AENCHRLAFIYRGKIVAEGTPQEMKSKQMLEQVLEVDCDPVEAGLTALRQAQLFDEVALYGALIHSIGHEVEAKIPQVRNILIAKGVTVYSVQVISPSLEDVFIARLRNVDLNEK
ncbi:MAG: ABC transporter ATP-binding protein, partial [Chloroflexota bacterium]|nr:ABC transporter ATP-binding protein [Chloroflexota bacterium]